MVLLYISIFIGQLHAQTNCRDCKLYITSPWNGYETKIHQGSKTRVITNTGGVYKDKLKIIDTATIELSGQKVLLSEIYSIRAATRKQKIVSGIFVAVGTAGFITTVVLYVLDHKDDAIAYSGIFAGCSLLTGLPPLPVFLNGKNRKVCKGWKLEIR